jgi:hypothetical protein
MERLHQEFEREYGGFLWNQWISISILSETNPMSWLDFCPLLIAWLASCLQLRKHSEMPEREELKWISMGISNRMNEHLFGWRHKLSVATSLQEGIYPFVQFLKSGKEEIVQLSELWAELPKFPIIPIDFAVCYSGEGLPFENSFWRLNDLEYDYGKLCQGMPWYDDKVAKNEDAWTKRTVSMVNSNVLKLLHDAFLNAGQWVHQLLDYMSRNRLLQFAVNNGNQRFISLLAGISLEYSKRHEKITTIPHDDAIRWGSFTIASPNDRLRRQLNETFEKLLTNPASSMLYASREDGLENDGLKIEQHIKWEYYSVLLGERRFRYSDLSGMVKLGSYDHLLDGILEQSPPSLLLDAERMKLYVWGNKITSKELVSQSFAVEMLVKLLEHPDKTVWLKELSPNTYTKELKELRGKIVSPLQKLLQKRLWLEMRLEVGTEDWMAFVRLKRFDGEIGILKKLW